LEECRVIICSGGKCEGATSGIGEGARWLGAEEGGKGV
jgi:hypothetical protein